MARPSRPAPVVVTGWGLVAVFGVLVWLVADEPGAGAVFAGGAVLMALWVALRPGTAAVVVSLVLGLLHTAEQVAYLVADLTGSPIAVDVVLADVVGLLGGLLVAGGAALWLVRRRRTERDRERRLSASRL